MFTLARLDKEHSGVMTDEGRRVRERRAALGMSQDDLAKEAGVNRDTVGAIENGLGFRRSSLTKIEAALDRIEEEVGMHAPAVSTEEGLVEIQVLGPDGKTAVAIVKGPVRDRDQLAEMVARLIREARD